MEPEQEEVFSFLGLNPLLLLEQPPANENILVRLVRPGEDSETILEESKKQLASISTRRRRKGRGSNGTNRVISRGVTANQSPNSTEDLIKSSPSEQKGDISSNLSSTEESQKIENVELSASESPNLLGNEIEDPRRRRRRSSAVSENGS